MAKNKSRKRATPFVPPSQRDFERKQRVAGGSRARTGHDLPPLKLDLGGDTTHHYRDGKLESSTTKTTPKPNPAPAPVQHAPAPAPAPAAPHAPKPRRLGRNLAIAGGATAALGGTGYLIHRHRQKELAVKSLIDPFAKAYPVVEPVPRSIRVAALRPTGKHLGHGQDLVHVKKGAAGDTVRGLKRAARFSYTGRGPATGNVERWAAQKPPGRVDAGFGKPYKSRLKNPPEFGKSLRDPKVNDKIPDGSRMGRRLA